MPARQSPISVSLPIVELFDTIQIQSGQAPMIKDLRQVEKWLNYHLIDRYIMKMLKARRLAFYKVKHYEDSAARGAKWPQPAERLYIRDSFLAKARSQAKCSGCAKTRGVKCSALGSLRWHP